MSATCRLIVNVDTDPDPASVPQHDDAILAKYYAMRGVLDDAGVRGAWCVLTGPICRTRFMEAPFLDFWRSLRDAGANLVLHPEEDLYGPPPDATPGQSAYLDDPHVRGVITQAAATMRAAGLPFDALRGGYHGLTPAMARTALGAGIAIDLACAPGISWPGKGAAWAEAPRTAYRMHPDAPARPDVAGPMVEIPWAAADGLPQLAKPFVVGQSFMINEFSTLDAMRAVWADVQARAAATGHDQTVSMLTHTFTIDRPECRERLADILGHVRGTGGVFATPLEAAASIA